MLLSLLARPHSSFKLLVLSVADPFFVVNAVKAGKNDELKWTVGHVPQKQLEATQAVNTKTLCQRIFTFAAKNEKQSLSDLLFFL